MAELSLILTLDLAALATAGWASRWLSRLSPGDEEDQRLSRALRSAADGITRKQLRQLVWSVCLALAVGATSAWLLSRTALFWFSVGATAGGLVCWTLGQIAQSFSLAAAAHANRAVAAPDSAVLVAVRTASATVLVVQVAALACGAVLLSFAAQDTSSEYGTSGAAFTGGAVCGALFAALFSLMIGSALRIACVVSRHGKAVPAARSFHWVEASNPNLILDLVAGHSSLSTARSQLLFVSSLVLQLVAISLPKGLVDPTAALAILLCTQAIALLSSAAILLTLRTDDGPNGWPSALWRGQVAAAVLSMCGVAGCAFWLLPEAERPLMLWCSAAGAALSLSASALSRRSLSGRSLRLEDRGERNDSSPLDGFTAVLHTLYQAPLFLGALALGLLVPWILAQGFVQSLQHLYWLTLGWVIALPYLTSQALLEPVLDSSLSLSSLRDQAGRGEHYSALGAHASLAVDSAAHTHRFACVSTGLFACLAAGILGVGADSTTLSAARPPLNEELWPATLTALAATMAIALALSLFVRQAQLTARTGLSESNRQQRLADGGASAGSSSKPGYAVYLEQTCSRGMRGAAFQCATILALFIWLWFVCIRFPSQPEHQPWLRQLSFLAFAAAAGITASLAGGGIASHLALTRMLRRPGTGAWNSSASPSSGLSALGGTALAPAALLLVNVVAVLSLTLPPLFT